MEKRFRPASIPPSPLTARDLLPVHYNSCTYRTRRALVSITRSKPSALLADSFQHPFFFPDAVLALPLLRIADRSHSTLPGTAGIFARTFLSKVEMSSARSMLYNGTEINVAL